METKLYLQCPKCNGLTDIRVLDIVENPVCSDCDFIYYEIDEYITPIDVDLFK